jgi:glutamyl-tRNA reductase
VLNLDHLRDWADRGVSARRAEAEHVRRIVADELERFTVDITSRQAAPLVAQLYEKAETIRAAEVERFQARLASLEPAQREAVEALTKGIVAKMLHQASTRLKDDAGTPQFERNAAAVRELFDLG